MYPVINECPVCKSPLIVTKLRCRDCNVNIEGDFTLGPFNRLSPEQAHFAETFIRCEGKINRVEEELKISYPTVRARLHELIRAMGFEVKEEPPPAAKPIDRPVILDELAKGTISAEEAAVHPQRSMLMRAVGHGRPLEVDLITERLIDGDRLMICSDGLSGMIDDGRISGLLSNGSVEEAVWALVEAANGAGGHDNVTVAAVDVES